MFSLGSGARVPPGPPCSLITSEWTIMNCYNSPLYHDVAQSSTEMINLIISHLSPHIYLLIETISPYPVIRLLSALGMRTGQSCHLINCNIMCVAYRIDYNVLNHGKKLKLFSDIIRTKHSLLGYT